ncbi:unnamed protein product, partial [Medioppia subpectinata]
MVAIAFTALSIPQFGKILSLIGGSSVTLMTFVLPPIFYLSLVSQQDQNKDWPQSCNRSDSGRRLHLFSYT